MTVLATEGANNPLSRSEFHDQLTEIERSFEASDFAYCLGCARLSGLIERGIDGIEHATPYVAKCLGFTERHARRLTKFGDVVRVVGPLVPAADQLVRDPWSGPRDSKTGRPVFREGQLRPLTKLLTNRDRIPEVFQDAMVRAGGDPLSHVHVEEAVEAAVGPTVAVRVEEKATAPPKPPAPKKPSKQQRLKDADVLLHRHDLANKLSEAVHVATLADATTDLIAAIGRAHGLAWGLFTAMKDRLHATEGGQR